jgi:glycosyltransferase involved in cell wall biosynthesis
MHVLFVHQNYPAQFGHIAAHLAASHGFRCTFVSERPDGEQGGVRRISYKAVGGATAKTAYATRGFENAVAHAQGVFDACKAHPWLKPDLIVGHSGFGSTLFLRELYDAPIVNYFEYFYQPRESDLDFRPEFPPEERDRLRSYSRNAMILLDLENCDAGYCPTRWQHGRLPRAYSDKVDVIFDGVDTKMWRRIEGTKRVVAGREVPASTRIVTYVGRGFESIRGFDIFMRTASRVYRAWPDVLFVVVGSDRIAYGGDLKYIAGPSFKSHVLDQEDYDLEKFVFTGPVPPAELARLLSIGDAHIYLTVPFVLSWSLFNALACGATIVASDTEPVRELIEPGRTGLLADFYDVEGLADRVLDVLRAPEAHRHLGQAGENLIRDVYALDRTLPRMLELYREVRR